MTPAGFPHSGIAGSLDACSSPTLFAAYHALRRLSVPRHPPCALVRLTGYVAISALLAIPCHTSALGARFFSFPSTQIVKAAWKSRGTSHDRAAVSPATQCKIRAWESVRRVTRSTCERLSTPEGLLALLQKGGDPAAGSPTATLLRLRPSHRTRLRPLPPEGWHTGFGRSRLPWRDGRCVQGPGTDSPWRS